MIQGVPFNKFQPMTQLTMHPAPGEAYVSDWIVFAQVNKPVGVYSCHYVVFQQGDDTEKTRFFFTSSGARSYYEHLIGSGKTPEQQRNTETWGCKSLEELKYLLEGKGRG